MTSTTTHAFKNMPLELIQYTMKYAMNPKPQELLKDIKHHVETQRTLEFLKDFPNILIDCIEQLESTYQIDMYIIIFKRLSTTIFALETYKKQMEKDMYLYSKMTIFVNNFMTFKSYIYVPIIWGLLTIEERQFCISYIETYLNAHIENIDNTTMNDNDYLTFNI